MKKTVMLLIMAAGLLSCAKEMTPAPEKAPAGVPMSFNITVTGTKAEKTNWANGDVVYVFFKGLEEKYLTLTYDGSGWTDASGGGTLTDTDFNGLTTQTLTAVHLPVEADVAFVDGAFVLTKGGNPVYNYYLYQTGKEYTVDGTTVTASLEMGKPAGIAQFHVAGITDYAELYSFSSSEIRPVACSGVTVDGSVVEKVKPAGDQLWGVDDANGLVFGGRLVNPGTPAEYQFLLTGPDKIYKLERSKKTLSAGARYNFPAPGEEGWEVAVDLGGKSYDFLHLAYYTFNTIEESRTYVDDEGKEWVFLQKLTRAGLDESVVWWTQTNPSYFIDANPGADQSGRVSNRYACADYDVAYFPLAELAFNVVDGDDNILTDDQIEAAGLTVEFTYADPELGSADLPEASQTGSFQTYDDLWINKTKFYYRTNEKPFIPMVGKLFITVDGEKYELPTRFSRPKASVKHPDVVLDYSQYAVVRWTPFKKPSADGITIVLDEHKIYTEPLLKGLNLKDNRPNNDSFSVIENGNWVIGNAATNATASSGSDGYVSGISSKDAYQITLSYEISIPNELKRLLSVKYSADGETFVSEQNEAGTLTPYIVFDYSSEVQFSGEIDIPVTATIESPWQEPLNVEYCFIVQGIS